MMSAREFQFDVFLSHSSKDKAVVRPLAERLRADGVKVWFDEWVLQPGDSIPAKIEEGLERSRVLVLCMSAQAFGSDWAQLESGTFRFRDPLNKERRFLPLRLDDAPIKGSLAQFLYVNWLPNTQRQEYAKLLDACLPGTKHSSISAFVAEIPNPIGAKANGEPTEITEDYFRRRRDTIEQVFSSFESIHAFFFKICIDYLSLVEVLHVGLTVTAADRDRYHGYIKEIGKRLHEMHMLEGRLRVAGAEQAVLSMQQYRLQATEVNDMLQLFHPKLRKNDVQAVTDELFRRKDTLYQAMAEAFKGGAVEESLSSP